MGWGRGRGQPWPPRSPGAGWQHGRAVRAQGLSLPSTRSHPAWAGSHHPAESAAGRSCPSRARQACPARPSACGARAGAKPGCRGLAEHSGGGLGTASTPRTSPVSPAGGVSVGAPSTAPGCPEPCPEPCPARPGGGTALLAHPAPKALCQQLPAPNLLSRPRSLPGEGEPAQGGTGQVPTVFPSFPHPSGPGMRTGLDPAGSALGAEAAHSSGHGLSPEGQQQLRAPLPTGCHQPILTQGTAPPRRHGPGSGLISPPALGEQPKSSHRLLSLH